MENEVIEMVTTTEIQRICPLEQIEQLEKLTSILPEIIDTRTREANVKHKTKLVSIRTELEKTRKRINKDLVDKNNADAAFIAGRLAPMEETVKAKVDAWDNIEKERLAEAARIEAIRVDGINKAIREIREIPGHCYNMTSEAIKDVRKSLFSRRMDAEIEMEEGEFQEYVGAAISVINSALERLASMVNQAEINEENARLAAAAKAEADKLAAEREEFEIEKAKLREEQEAAEAARQATVRADLEGMVNKLAEKAQETQFHQDEQPQSLMAAIQGTDPHLEIIAVRDGEPIIEVSGLGRPVDIGSDEGKAILARREEGIKNLNTMLDMIVGPEAVTERYPITPCPCAPGECLPVTCDVDPPEMVTITREEYEGLLHDRKTLGYLIDSGLVDEAMCADAMKYHFENVAL